MTDQGHREAICLAGPVMGQPLAAALGGDPRSFPQDVFRPQWMPGPQEVRAHAAAQPAHADAPGDTLSRYHCRSDGPAGVHLLNERVHLAALAALLGLLSACDGVPTLTGSAASPQAGPSTSAPANPSTGSSAGPVPLPVPCPPRQEAPAGQPYPFGPAAGVLVEQSRIDASDGKLQAASSALVHALHIEPENPGLLLEMGQVMTALDGPSAGKKGKGAQVKQLARGSPQDRAQAWRLIADWLKARGNAHEADYALQQAASAPAC